MRPRIIRQSEPRAPPQNKHKQQRIGDIELFLDAERPCVQQRRIFRRIGKIVRRADHEPHVGDEQRGRRRRLREADQIDGQDQEQRQAEACEDHRKERGKYPPEASLVEAQERDASLLEITLENPGDQIAGYDEKHVDADKPAGNAGQAGVKQQDRHDRDRPQPVDVRAVFAARRRGRGMRHCRRMEADE